MYRWYKQLAVCYVYLEDVLDENKASTFAKSAWFTRGWTLQELLAPRKLQFYDARWSLLGDKHEFLDQIEEVNNIDRKALTGDTDLSSYPIATRMSWTAGRKTTRSEDMAYSLMGIFDVSMPILYGEGSKAFLRLQNRIIRHSDDRSIFCWISADESNSGLLASSPAHFSHMKGQEGVVQNIVASYLRTNRGLSIDFILEPVSPGLYITTAARIRHRDLTGELSNQNFEIFLGRVCPEDPFQYTRVLRIGDKQLSAADVEPLVSLAVNRKQYTRPSSLRHIDVCSKPFFQPALDLCFTVIDIGIDWGLELSRVDARPAGMRVVDF